MVSCDSSRALAKLAPTNSLNMKHRNREQTRRRSNPTTSGKSPLLALLACLVFLGWPAEWPASTGKSSFQVMAQNSVDQASSAISMLLKPNQESACDGEQLEIKCNDDYVIEIITTELTILARELHATTTTAQDNRVTAASATLTGSADDTRTNPGASGGEQSLASTAASVGNQTTTTTTTAAAQAVESTTPAAICAPLKSAANNYRPTGSGEEACNEQRAGELSAESQARVLQLIRKHCSLLNSCSLDLSPAGNTTTGTGAGTGDVAAFASLGQFLTHERWCPRNRKLLELAYKCRPSRVKSRSACRQQKLQLECAEPGKRIALGSAAYGFWLEDKKTNERCAQEEERVARAADPSAGRPTSVQLYKSSCSTGGGGGQQAAFGAIARECLFKRQCQVPVERQVFAAFESTCNNLSPRRQQLDTDQHLEYLKVIYVCLSEELLLTTNSSLILRQLSSTRSNSDITVTPTTASSSHLLQASTAQPPPQPHSQSQANLQVVDQVAGATPSLRQIDQVLQVQVQGAGDHHLRHNQQEDEIQAATSGRVFAIVASDPHLANVHPSQWSVGQRVKFVLLQYQNHLVAFAVITIAISTLLAFVTRLVCAAGSRRSTSGPGGGSSSGSGPLQKSMFAGGGTGSGKGSSSSTSSTASSNSTSSSNFTNQSGGSSGANLAGQQLLDAGLNHLSHFAMQGHNHLLTSTSNHYSKPAQITLNTGAGRAPTNSCSESCFSLDDFNNQQQHHNHHQHKQVAFQVDSDRPTLRGGGDSPALQSQQTATPPCGDQGSLLNYQQDHHLQQLGGATVAVARPKLWSFYGNEQHSNSLRLGAGGALQQQIQQQVAGGSQLAATLRPQRTFMGQLQQQQQPTLARNFQCLQPNPGEMPPQPLEPHQSDYLLAMAAVTQQHHLHHSHQPVTGGGTSQAGNWCAAHSHDHQPDLPDDETAAAVAPTAHLQPPQLRLLSLNPAELLQQQQQQQAPTSAPSQTCAFHSQPQQQQMFSPQELPTLHQFDHQHQLMTQHNHPHR